MVIVVGEWRCVALAVPLASVLLRRTVRSVKVVKVAPGVPWASGSDQRKTSGALTYGRMG